MKYSIEIAGAETNVILDLHEQQLIADCKGKKYTVNGRWYDRRHFIFRLNGNNYDVLINGSGNTRDVLLNGKPCRITIQDSRTRKLKEISTITGNKKHNGEVRAPMPGLVLKILVKEGDVISANDGLMIIEAMKMENEIRATADGTVKKVVVKNGQAVDKGTLLLHLA